MPYPKHRKSRVQMEESHGMTRTESIERSYNKYTMAVALLQAWEKTPDAEPDYLAYLQRRVRYLHGQLVNKGAICPNKT